MKLKIIAGLYHGRKLLEFKYKNIRPSKNIVRDAMFNIIGKSICNANVLDLFAGSGAIGIEAISRGASFVYFVDNNFKAIEIIKKNLEKIEISSDNYKIINCDYKKAIKEIKNNKKIKFDIVIIDPPYQKNEYVKIFNLLNEILNEKIIIIIESVFLDLKLFDFIKNKYQIKQKKYGKTLLTIFKKF